MTRTLASWIDGKPVELQSTDAAFDLVSPIDGKLLYRIVETDKSTVDLAVNSAHAAYMKHRRSTIAQRVAWMEALAKAFEQDSGRISQMIVDTIGKPRKAANFEASRVGAFLRNTIAELLAGRGEVLPLDSAPAGAGHLGYARRVPCGVVAAITPFNAPANLLVQKLAPALATGNAMVVKPHPTGIEVALAFAELAKQAGLPDGLFNVVTGDRSAALELVAHPLTSVITLTGGVAAARALSAAAGPKKFCAELGSNAANLVLADANLDDAATKIAAAGFEASGQPMPRRRVRASYSSRPWMVHCCRRRSSSRRPMARGYCARKRSGRWWSCSPRAISTMRWRRPTIPSSACRAHASRPASIRHCAWPTSSTAARSGSTRRAASGSTCIRSAA